MQYSGYKLLKPSIPGATAHATAAVPAAAGTTNPPIAADAAKGGKKEPAAVLTVEEHKEKVEPGRDAFQEPPADVINESLKAELAETGPNAPAGKEKEKQKEQKESEEKKKLEELEDKVGPLLPSDLAKVGSERDEKKVVPVAEKAGAPAKVAEKKVDETTEVDLTAVEHVVPKEQDKEEADFKIQTAPNEKKAE